MLAHQSRNNNGQAHARVARFRWNAANESDSLLDDLGFNEGSTTYTEREEGSLNH
jgi:hypothetical protein